MKYQPGLHILCDIENADNTKLVSAENFRILISTLISEFGLTETGSVYYSFENAGFTCVTGLTESHLSVHTWPEYNRVTFDVFLSNFMKVNDGICESLCDKISSYFGGEIVQMQKVKR